MTEPTNYLPLTCKKGFTHLMVIMPLAIKEIMEETLQDKCIPLRIQENSSNGKENMILGTKAGQATWQTKGVKDFHARTIQRIV